MQLAVNDKASLLNLLALHRNEIKNYGVERLGIFGSFVKDDVNETSDVDLLVEFNKGKKTYDNFFELSEFLQNLLQRKVELVTPQSLSKYIAPHLLKQVENVTL
jgi:predicted nucleotidyltransferase